jgi:hypothetical protein
MAVYAPGRTSVLNVVAAWQGGPRVADLGSGRMAATAGSTDATDAYVSSLGSGRFALDDAVTVTHRLRYQGSRLFIDSI